MYINNIKNLVLYKKLAIFLFFIMFLYSGINKIFNFNKKTSNLQKKIGMSFNICAFGMILVILLETIGTLILYYYYFINNKHDKIHKKYINLIYILFLLFVVVVTFIYHPPNDKIIPFLSNLTTFAGILYLYMDFISDSTK